MTAYIKKNLDNLRADIEKACTKAGRSPGEVMLVAVSKTVGIDEIEEAIACGCTVFGENRVQDMIAKCDHFGDRAEFHMIGHLQTNKVRQIIGRVSLIHSVDSLRLLEEIEKRAAAADVIQDILIQVDVSGEETKFGASVEEMEAMIIANESNKHVKIRGLMTMAPFTADSEEIRWVFRKLMDVFIDTSKKTFYNTYMEYSSMGMSGDFAVAIEEGANIVRVGSRIFRATY